MVRASPGHYLLSIDLSQAEGWVVAYLANEPTMKKELQFGDIHSNTARYLYDLPDTATIKNGMMTEDQRFIGKKCNHAFNYLMSAEFCVDVINKEGRLVVSLRDTKKFRNKYLELYRLQNWWFSIEEELRNTHTLTTPYGFTRRFYQTFGRDLYKEGTAFIPQSTIADHIYGRIQPQLGIKGGLLEVYNQILSRTNSIRLCQSAHDSGLFEVSEDLDVKEVYGDIAQYIKRPMVVNGEQFTIPCDAKWGPRWEEFEKVAA